LRRFAHWRHRFEPQAQGFGRGQEQGLHCLALNDHPTGQRAGGRLRQIQAADDRPRGQRQLPARFAQDATRDFITLGGRGFHH
jgi:hypothetical protein